MKAKKRTTKKPASKTVIKYRDYKTNKFVKPHSQKYLQPEIYKGKKFVSKVGNFRQGIDKKQSWNIEHLYNSPEVKLVSETNLKVSYPASVHQTLLNHKDLFTGASYADVIIRYGKHTFKLNKVALRETGMQIFDRWNYDEDENGNPVRTKKNASELDLLRIAIKRELENNGYAITPKNIRLQTGDNKTKAYARGTKKSGKKKDGKDIYIKCKKLKTIKPSIKIRVYK